MICVEEATLKLLENITVSTTTEIVDLGNSVGRVLAEDIFAERDSPPFDRVMMDGYALYGEGNPSGTFQIQGIALAGHEPPTLSDHSACIEVTTGCPLPDGCNTIIPVEYCSVEKNQILIPENLSIVSGQFIHKQASDGSSGRVVLKKGIPIGPPEIAILATEGIQSVQVVKFPRVGLLTTGDEIVLPGQTPNQFQIRGSHQETLKSLFKVLIGIDLATCHAMDDEEDIASKLSSLLLDSDFVLITGGVSKGRKDLIPDLLETLGVMKLYHAVAQRPGKPIWVGRKERKLVFGLPGNPISALTCSRRYVIPAIEKWLGKTCIDPMTINVKDEIKAHDSFTSFIPVRLEAGSYVLSPFSTSGSLHNLAQTAGFIEVPPRTCSDKAFKFYPWF